MSPEQAHVSPHVPKRVVTLLALLAALTLALPAVVLGRFDLATAGTLIGLVAWGSIIATISHGIRAGLIGSLAMGFISCVGLLAATQVVAGIAVMTSAAVGFGLLARIGWQRSMVMYPVALAFMVTERTIEPTFGTLVVFGLALAGVGAAASFAVKLIVKSSPPASPPSKLSWSRTYAFAGLLAVTQLVAASIALINDWGHTGGWLMMTPFLVMQPYIHDGWVRSLRRAVGTVGGFITAVLLGTSISSPLLLTLIGYAFALIGLIAYVKRAGYAVYVFLLTPAVVILESVGRPVVQTADDRLAATLIGVGLSLAAMAIALPMYRRQEHRD